MKSKSQNLFFIFSGLLILSTAVYADDNANASQVTQSFASYSSFSQVISKGKAQTQSSGFAVNVYDGAADSCSKDTKKAESKKLSQDVSKTVIQWQGAAYVSIKQNGKPVTIAADQHCVVLDKSDKACDQLDITASSDPQGKSSVYAMHKAIGKC